MKWRWIACSAAIVLTLGCGGGATEAERPWNRIEVTRAELPVGYISVQAVSDDGRTLVLGGNPTEIGVQLRGHLVSYPIENASFSHVSPNGAFAAASSWKRISGSDDYESNIYLWEELVGIRKILTRRGRGMVVLSLHNAGSLIASFLSGGGPVTETTIFFTPPDQVVETPGPPPKPDIPIVAPPGYHDAGVFWYSHNERYAAGSALDSTGRSHGLIWNSEGHATVLPPLDGSDPFSEGAFYVSNDATRALYSARSVHAGWIRALWIKGREPVFLEDLLKRAGEPEWDHPDWSFGARSANGRYFTLSRFDGKEYLVHVP